jgi:hypothetical protein
VRISLALRALSQQITMQSSSLVVRRELLESVTDLTERGLYYAAKWYRLTINIFHNRDANHPSFLSVQVFLHIIIKRLYYKLYAPLMPNRSAEQALGLGITSADDEVVPTTITYLSILNWVILILN